MSRCIHRSWTVFDGIENHEHDRCVGLFQRPDLTFGFEEFRRDAEDAGAWTPVQFYSGAAYETKEAVLDAATGLVGWLAERLEVGGQSDISIRHLPRTQPIWIPHAPRPAQRRSSALPAV